MTAASEGAIRLDTVAFGFGGGAGADDGRNHRPLGWTRTGPPGGSSDRSGSPRSQNIALALTIVGTIAFVFACTVLTSGSTRDERFDAVPAGRAWLRLVEQQRWDDAYRDLCDSDRSAVDHVAASAELEADFAGLERVGELRHGASEFGEPIVTGHVEIEGERRSLTLVMQDQGFDYTVCHYRLGTGS